MKTEEQIMLEYLNKQFPATIGHIPLAAKIHAVWKQGMTDAAEIAGSKIHEWACDKMIQTHVQARLAASIIENAIIHKSNDAAATPNAPHEPPAH